MYSSCGLCRRDAAGRSPLNGVGLGEESEYQGQSKTGGMVSQVASMISLPVGMVPGFNQVAKATGFQTDPLNLALVSNPLTAWTQLIPGFNKMIGGLFKKATHMGDCMKWWSDSNIRGMVGGIQPYPFSFQDYMMKNFPQFLRQYQIKQADGTWASVGVDNLLNAGNRRARIANIFIGLVRSNPDIMKLQCAVQHRGETGYTGHTQAQVNEIWDQIKEVARQQEYSTIAEEVDKLVAPFKVKETWGAIVKSRATASLIPMGTEAKLRMPENVIGVRRGALVMTLKTPQGQPTPIRK